MLLNLNPNGRRNLSLANPNAMVTALDAISNGKQKLRHGTICVLGDARVGKTSLVRSLMGKRFQQESGKTEGIDATLVETRNADENWGELQESDLPDFQRVVNKSVAESLNTSAKGNPIRVLLNILYAITSTDMLLSKCGYYIRKLGIESQCWRTVLQFHFLVILLFVTVMGIRLLGLGILIELIEFAMLREINSAGFLRWNLLALCFGINCLRVGETTVYTFLAKQTLESSFSFPVSESLAALPEVGKEVLIFLVLFALFSILVFPCQPSEISFHRLHNQYLQVGFVPTYAHIALRAVFVGMLIGWGLLHAEPRIEHGPQFVHAASYSVVLLFNIVNLSGDLRFLNFLRRVFGFDQRNLCGKTLDFAMGGSILIATLQLLLLFLCYFCGVDVIFLFVAIITCELTIGVLLRYIIRLKDGEGQRTFTQGCPSQYRTSGRTGLPTHQFILQRYVGLSFFRQAATLLEDKERLKQEQELISGLKFLIQDFAGDEEYYSYHHLFILDQAICIIVFKLIEAQDKLDFITRRLLFWLSSIRAHTSSTNPCIFLVGTHRGQVTLEQIQEANRYLQSKLLPQFGEVIECDGDCVFFAVENLHSSDDPGIAALRRRIIFTSRNEVASQVEDDVPLRWLEISQAIRDLRASQSSKAGSCENVGNSNADLPKSTETVSPSKMCMRKEDFRNFLKSKKLELKDNEDFEKMLRYFHRKGLVLYIQRKTPVKISNISASERGNGVSTLTADEMSDWLLLNPQILAKAEIAFVRIPDRLSLQEKGYRKDWQILSRTGYLTERLVEHSLAKFDQNPQALLSFMEVCNLVCRLVRPTQLNTSGPICSHFLPARLPRKRERAESQVLWHHSKQDKEFFFDFHGFLPEAVFLRILARAYTHSCLCNSHLVPQVYRDEGLFWLDRNTSFLLEFLEEKALIKVTASSNWSRGMQPSDVMATLWSMVSGVCNRDFQYLVYHCGPACPLPACTSEITGICRDLETNTKHIHNIFPRCCEEIVDSISLSCGNIHLNEQLREWIPSCECNARAF